MCEATTMFISSLALSALSAGAGYMDAKAQAKSQLAYQEAQMRANNQAALQNADNAIREQNEQTSAERTQQMQEAASASREQQALQKDYLQKKGTAVASSPYGAGASLDALMADYHRSFAVGRDVIQEQLEMQGVGHDIAVSGYRDRADSRIRSQQSFIPAPVTSGGNIWATALGLGANALGSYNKATNYGDTPLGSRAASYSTVNNSFLGKAVTTGRSATKGGIWHSFG